MTFSLGLIWFIATALSGLVIKVAGVTGLKAAGRESLGMFKPLVIRLPCALLAAALLMQIAPLDPVSKLIGSGTGMPGILAASVLGAFLPGGPMVVFPIAVVLQQAGAGVPQLVALIAGWSVFDLNRMLTYEAPVMSWRFATLRTLSCLMLPVLAGFGAQLIQSLSGAP